MMKSSAYSIAILSLLLAVAPNPAPGGTFDFEETATFPGAAGEIPDEGIMIFPVQISPKVNFIASLELEINGLSHDFAEDLDLYLIAPFDGIFIELMTDRGGAFPASEVDLIFRDTVSGIPGAPLASGAYQPEGLFNGTDSGFEKFVGHSSGAGPWLLLAIDDAPADSGRIDSITIRGTVPEPTVLSLLVMGALAMLRRRTR